jgi:transcriptional regulator with GAF, ATPase, and Fis domain
MTTRTSPAGRLSTLVRVFPDRAAHVIAAALANTGQIRKAARILGVHRLELGKHVRRLGEERVWGLALEKMRGRA